jgi:hypothetical protein
VSAEMTGRQKERVQFDFSLDALHRLDALKEKTDAATRAETVRNALRIYEWLISEVDEVEYGNTIEAEVTIQKAMRLYRWLKDEADNDSTIKIYHRSNEEPTAVVKAKLFLR